MTQDHLWAIVLAAGEGRRLSSLTRDARGVPVPKQYCSFGRGRAMLHWALDRAASIAPRDRVVTIVAEEHREWWTRELRALDPGNVVVQPRNRGTAAGILLPLVSVLRRDPEAIVVVLPSDHHVEDEATLAKSMRRAVAAVTADPDRAVLLGITPEEVDTQYGWILPRKGGGGAVRPVERFVEKPGATVAAELLLAGALWNSFVFVASGRLLLHLFEETLPELLEPFLRELVVSPRAGALEELYERIPERDFSKELLQRVPERLDLVAVPPCGWSDLGTPERLGRFLDDRVVSRSA
jgi:mannose-1-phosphate guanylyltransferase